MVVPTERAHLDKLEVLHELLSHNYVCGTDISGISQDVCNFEKADRSFNLFTRKYWNKNVIGCHGRMEAHVYLTERGAKACWVCGGSANDGMSELAKIMGAKKCYPQCYMCLMQGWKPTEIKTNEKTRDTVAAAGVGAANPRADTEAPKDGDDDVVVIVRTSAASNVEDNNAEDVGPVYEDHEHGDNGAGGEVSIQEAVTNEVHVMRAEEERKAKDVTCDFIGCVAECFDGICLDHGICKQKEWGYCEEHCDNHDIMLQAATTEHSDMKAPVPAKDKKTIPTSKLEIREIQATNRKSLKVLQKKAGKKDMLSSIVDDHPTLMDPLSTLPCNACPHADAPVTNIMASRVSSRVREVNFKYRIPIGT
jgi:hypothetical protein